MPEKPPPPGGDMESHDMQNTGNHEQLKMKLISTEQDKSPVDEKQPDSLVIVAIRSLFTLEKLLFSIEHILQKIAECKTEKSASSMVPDFKFKWRQIALVMDRIFMIVYLFIVIISLIVLLPRPQ